MNSVFDFLTQLLHTEGFPPRWLCGTGWLPFTGWFMITADLMIFTAYTSIPLLLLYFINKKKDMAFPKIFWLFAAFIFACGVSHLLDAIMFWWPAYRLNALEKFITGLISWATVFTLIPIIPEALKLKSPLALEKEIEERKKIETELRDLNLNLEQMVTERTQALNEKAWQLEAINKELEAFSYSVSHDLKAPLRKIEQFSDMILINQTEAAPPELKLYLERIAANATQMRELIEDMLRFSKVANAELHKEPINLTEMSQQILCDLQTQEPDRQAEWTIANDLQTEADPLLLKSVLENLLGNAWKYTSKEDLARIEIGFQNGNGTLTYYVKDNGVGFDMKNKERLFKPFQRLHLKADFPGTGIGLASVQRIINRHGGKIWAEATPGSGATFFFTLKGS
jgi:chemotaxis family two-component system sensor kinase Cph1